MTTRVLPLLTVAVLAAALTGCSSDSPTTSTTASASQVPASTTPAQDPTPAQTGPTSSKPTVSAESLAGTYEYFDVLLSDGTYYSDYMASLPNDQKSDMGLTPTLTLNADMTAQVEWADGSGDVYDGTWEIVNGGIRLRVPGVESFADATAVADGKKLTFDDDDLALTDLDVAKGSRTIYERVSR
jgi:hypothetical protein